MDKNIVLKINEEIQGTRKEISSIEELMEELNASMDESVYEVTIKKRAAENSSLDGLKMEHHPSIDDIKKHLSMETPHLIQKLTRAELAAWIQALFFNNRIMDNDPESQIVEHIMKKEIAFQAIRMILDGESPENVTIKTEKDWIRYFQLENQNP